MCCVAFCSSTLPSTETAGAARTHNERHSQLCRPARWHSYQTKPSLCQLLNYLTAETSNSVEHSCNKTSVDKRRWCWNGEIVFEMMRSGLWLCRERHTIHWRWLQQKYLQCLKRIRTPLLFCSKVPSSCALVPDVWLTQQAQGCTGAWAYFEEPK